MANNIFKVEDLCFSYDNNKPILNHLNFEIRKGKITTIMGANGCGKSTLFQILTKNLKPYSGDISLNENSITQIDIKKYAKKVAIVNQYNTAPDDLTVEQLVEYGRTPYRGFKTDPKEMEYGAKKVEQAMKITGVYGYKDKTVNSLSGGQRQRVWIALALAQGTKILLLDETTTYLDIKYQQQILKLIRVLNQKLNMTIIMVLHDINQALLYSDDIIALSPKGRLLAKGLAEVVITKPILKKMYNVDLEIVKINGDTFVVTV